MSWKSAITNAGLDLINTALVGGDIVFTKALAAEGSFDFEDLKTATQLSGTTHDLSIARVSDSDTGKKFTMRIGASATSEYSIRQIGLFGKMNNATEEILIVVAESTVAELVPTETNVPDFVLEYNLVLPILTSKDVTVVLDSSTFTTKSDVMGILSDQGVPSGTELNNMLGQRALKNHKHSASDITDMPTSFPANGGNADTLGGIEASKYLRQGDSIDTRLNELGAVPTSSTDIRALASTLVAGHFVVNTSQLPTIVFPISGEIQVDLSGSFMSNGLYYGTMTIRPMLVNGKTWISSIYNTTKYTDWYNIADGGKADIVNCVQVIGSADACTYHSILDWANAYNGGSAWAFVISDYGFPTDAPVTHAGAIRMESDGNTGKIITFHDYVDSQKTYSRTMNNKSWLSSQWVSPDAGTLNGKSASEFASVRKLTTAEQVNSILESGIYSVENVATTFGSISSAFYMLIVNKRREDRNYNTELAIPYVSGLQQGVYYRNCANGTWGAWTHVGNGGNAATVNGHTVNADVPANAKFREYTIATGTTNGTINVTYTSGGLPVTKTVAVKGLASAAYQAVQTTAATVGLHKISAGTAAATTTNCPAGCWYGQYK